MGFLIVIFFIMAIIVGNIKIVPQASTYVVERLGAYKETWGVGLHFLVPFIDQVGKRMS